MWRCCHIFLLSSAITFDVILSYGSGAPDNDPGVCRDMVPMHRYYKPQTSPSPYSIQLSATSYKPGNLITVTLIGQVDFKGVLVQARAIDATTDTSLRAIGEFRPANGMQYRCNKQALTHSGPLDRNRLTVYWRAPSVEAEAFSVRFVATFVQKEDTFWTFVKSNDLSGPADQLSAVVAPPPSSIPQSKLVLYIEPKPRSEKDDDEDYLSPVVTNTTFYLDDNSSYPDQNNLTASSSFQHFTDADWRNVSLAARVVVASSSSSIEEYFKPTEPEIGPKAEQIERLFTIPLESCGVDKSCLLTSDCKAEVECDQLITWRKDPDQQSVDFEMSFKHVPGRQEYMALGLSHDAFMGNDSVIICSYFDQAIDVYHAFNTKKSSSAIDPASVGSLISNEKGSYENGRVRCSFSRRTGVGKSRNVFRLNEDLVLFPAWGPMAGKRRHEKHIDTPLRVDGKHNVASMTPQRVSLAMPPYSPLIKAHGVLMLLAWVFFASSGILMARYYKPMWPNQKMCGVQFWFAVHRPFLLTTVCLVVIAFILILVKVEGTFILWEELPQRAHPILGLIAIILMLINPIMALFRCKPDAKYRPVFNWFHWAVGTIAHIFAILTIFIGFTYKKARVPEWVAWVLVVWCIFQMACEIILELHGCLYYKKNKQKREEFEMRKTATPSNTHPSPEHSGRRFKTFMLIFYFVISVLLNAVMVIGILVT